MTNFRPSLVEQKHGQPFFGYSFSCCATPRRAARRGRSDISGWSVVKVTVPATYREGGGDMTQLSVIALGISLGAVVIVLALNLKRED